jgi:large subunit ribosomal protein L12
MKYIYAALLLHESGKEINEENLKKLMEVVGEEIDEARIKSLAAALKNVDIDEVISTALTMPTVAAQAPTAPAEKPAEEAPKEEAEEEEKEEEEALEGLGALFG